MPGIHVMTILPWAVTTLLFEIVNPGQAQAMRSQRFIARPCVSPLWFSHEEEEEEVEMNLVCFPSAAIGITCAKSGVKCLYTNACSTGNEQEELGATVLLESYDLVAITETWWNKSHDWSVAIDGYKLFRRDSWGLGEEQGVDYSRHRQGKYNRWDMVPFPQQHMKGIMKKNTGLEKVGSAGRWAEQGGLARDQCSYIPPCARDDQENSENVTYKQKYWKEKVGLQPFTCYFNQHLRPDDVMLKRTHDETVLLHCFLWPLVTFLVGVLIVVLTVCAKSLAVRAEAIKKKKHL
ncbi:PREDICTED: calcium-activated potassium channel subunit beta-4 [Pygoscelis adeliae]|uniref:calcium-activated potassium channel subunit beta-4 n=1 Tax=Pygoscelis adeliae TaxID=9238 RepID=UPI0004F4E47E|nr:PREDICTED: calcium-activated potassium channel subunit beta-4 [Pygoscelis adeliae]